MYWGIHKRIWPYTCVQYSTVKRFTHQHYYNGEISSREKHTLEQTLDTVQIFRYHFRCMYRCDLLIVDHIHDCVNDVWTWDYRYIVREGMNMNETSETEITPFHIVEYDKDYMYMSHSS